MKVIRLEVYPVTTSASVMGIFGSSREWRWRAISHNGKVLASGEGYKRRGTMCRTLRRLFPDEAMFPIVEAS